MAKSEVLVYKLIIFKNQTIMLQSSNHFTLGKIHMIFGGKAN